MCGCSLQIAKDMERWAKSVNAAKSAQQQQLQALITQERAETQVPQPVAQTTVLAAQPSAEAERISEMKKSGMALSAALEVT